ncbi:MAG TPA: TRAP transporter substrate-binding protein DctP [Stellaceae bacterium]|nr:TRAP transporter substrate-binding protein DctP [Stellaceae bacterium]
MKQLGFGGALALCLAMPAHADVTLTMNVAMPRASSFFVGVQQPWAQMVEAQSHGHIKIVMPAASMAPLPRQWEMVTSGIADIAESPSEYIKDRVRLPVLAEIPFLAPNGVAASVAIWRTYEKYFVAANEYKGVKLLGFWTTGGNVLQTVKRPVTKIDDFEGLKIWVATPNMATTIRNFGATPVLGVDMFDTVSGGIVDGAVAGKGALISFQLARYTKEITFFPGQLGYTLQSFFMNQKKYDSLAPEDRAVIDKLSGEPFARMAGQGFVDQDNLADPLIKKDGIGTHRANPEFMKILKEKVAFYKDNWMADAKARGVDAQAAYDFYVKTAQDSASLMR